MRGDVKLNNVWYKTQGLPVQSLANQMAAKVGQGTSEYGDLTSWSAWIQEDWQEGVGRLQPHKRGGMLYADLESRVPSQLILSGLIKQVDTRDIDGTEADLRYMPNNMAGSFTIGSALSSTKAAIRMPSHASGRLYWVYCSAPVGTVINFEVRDETASSPGSTVRGSATLTIVADSKGFYWYGIPVAGTGSASTSWLSIYPSSGTMQVGYGTSGYPTASQILTSGTWVAQAGKYMMYSTSAYSLDATLGGSGGAFGFFRYEETLYTHGIGNEPIYTYDTINDEWDVETTSSFGDYFTSAVTFLGDVYLSQGRESATSFMQIYSGAGVWANTALRASLVARNGGYLWRAYENKTYYSDDATTWVHFDEMDVGTPEYPILGMCGLGNDMFVSTAEGLYRITEGDFAVSVCSWDSISDGNGRSMVNFQGALYIAANDRVLRYSEDGTVQDVWIGRDDDIVQGRLGKVKWLVVVNNSVFALLSGQIQNSLPTLWAFQNESWHHIATLPNSPDANGDFSYLVEIPHKMFYDYETQQLWIVMPTSITYRLYISDFAKNPYNDTSTLYTPTGWIEWDWFNSAILEAQKDYHSVVVFGENFDATCTATVYWKDDDSTAWETLGTIDSNNEELTWTITGGTRPNTKRLKLALLLTTTDSTQTPRVRAVRVKYHPMVKDWFRWNLNIHCSGRTGGLQEVADGDRHTLTGEQIKDNIDALCTQVAPFVYQDADGTDYLVKVVDGNFAYQSKEYNEATTNSWWEGVYRLTLDAVTAGTYSA